MPSPRRTQRRSARAAPGAARGRATPPRRAWRKQQRRRGRAVERRLLDRAPGFLVRRRPVARCAEPRQLDQPVGARVELEQREQLLGIRVLHLAGRSVRDERARRVTQLLDPLCQLRPAADVERQLTPRGAQGLVDAREHPSQPARAVRGEQAKPLRLPVGTELVEGGLERLAAEHGTLRVVELAEPRVESRSKRVRLEQAEAEAVDRRDPGAVELAREIMPPALRQRGPDARAQLARGTPRVGDHEDRVDVEPAVAHGAHEALDEHRRLPGARAGRDEDLALGGDRGQLLLVHGRGTRHIGQRSHHCGQSPPRGSCRTSPVPMRPASRLAVSFALSTVAQNASSSR